MNKIVAAVKRISTHTLTWSVTFVKGVRFMASKISTHTLTWSVTPDRFRYTAYVDISTHTLTWSVTTPIVSDTQHMLIFQLTRSRGA